MACLLGVKEEADNVTIQISCLLLEAKADVEIKNKDGKSPLDLCNDFATKEFMKRCVDFVPNTKIFRLFRIEIIYWKKRVENMVGKGENTYHTMFSKVLGVVKIWIVL